MHTPVGDVGSESEVVLCQAFRSERPSGGGLETEVSPPVGKVGRSQKTGVAPPRPDLPVGIGSPFWPGVQIFGPAPELRDVCLGRASVGKLVREGPRVYEPDRSPPSPRAIRVESSGGFLS